MTSSRQPVESSGQRCPKGTLFGAFFNHPPKIAYNPPTQGRDPQAARGEGWEMTTKVGILGGGSWGTTVASLASRNADVQIWARNPCTTWILVRKKQ